MRMGAVRGASRTAFFLWDPCWTFTTTRAAVKRQQTTGNVGKWREWTWAAALSRRRSRVRGSRCYSAAMLLPLGTYLCRLSLRLLHPLGTVSAFAFLCIQRYTDNAAHAMETNIEQNPQSVRWNHCPGAQIPQRFLRLSAHLSDSNYPGAAYDTGACLGSYAGNYAGRIPKYPQVAPYHKMRNA
jgi:hypothetical protein